MTRPKNLSFSPRLSAFIVIAAITFMVPVATAVAQSGFQPNDRQSDKSRYDQNAGQRSSGNGGYDPQTDRWRPGEPRGNAFERNEVDVFGSAPVEIKPRAAQDDGLVVRDLAEPGRSPSGANGGGGLAGGAWSGLDRQTFLKLATKLPYPNASPTLSILFRRLLTSADAPTNEPGLDALRAELLYRSGMVDAVELIARAKRSGADRPIVQVTRAKALLAIGKLDQACETAERVDREARSLAKQSRRDLFSLVAYCAAFDGDTARARRIMARADKLGLSASVPFAIVTMLSSGAKPRTAVPKRLKLIDYKFLQLAKARATMRVVKIAEPALLSSLARDSKVSADVRSRALDKAMQWSMLEVSEVAAIVRDITERVRKGKSVPVAEILSKGGRASPQQFRELAKSLSFAHHAFALSPIIARDAIDAGRARLDTPALGAIVKLLVAASELKPAQDLVRKASQAAGRPDAQIDNWLTLINIADASASIDRKAGLAASASLARRGLMNPVTMHRLVTVLDALGYNVPIPLWEATNRIPQPTTGFLPPTGVLAKLRNASRSRQQGKTVLLAMTAIGKNGPAETNLIALADVIRALRRNGMEGAARRLAVEALWPVWPKNNQRFANQ